MRIAAFDLGTNSFHLLVVDAHPDGTFAPLVREKEMLRLGDEVSRGGRIGEAAMNRAVTTVRRYRTLAEGVDSDDLVACATSAIREAENGGELVDRIESEAGVRISVISGLEEARLIFEAIRASVVIDPGPALCLDLGGGSLEVMVGDASGLRWASSVKLGAARLTAELVGADPPSSEDVRRLRERITSSLAPLADEVAHLHPTMAVGTSGTFLALTRMVAARRPGGIPTSVNQLSFGRDEFLAVHDHLMSLSAPERARLPGLDARRADIIPAGSVLLITAMELFGFDELTVSEWALREGIVLDRIKRHDDADWSGDPRAIRHSSVLRLARGCNWDEGHSRQATRLALDLFDQTLALHGLTPADRELLEHAGLLHDIGEHVATESHHKHTAYLIQHGRLRGFSPEEVAEVAALARYHRGGDPRPSSDGMAGVAAPRRESLARLAALLRVADGLDRGRAAAVGEIDVALDDARVRVHVRSDTDIDVDLWGGRRKRELFERLFDRRLELVRG
ncbi:MAG: exopolyphosphatase / guanosine-5-triphosphate,3-diphosphate pyrophosphatase [Acidimicrobiaceae bacterium]|jgi:exopolyphosphatase/guanosine-5'-triphosphate,3'-diphosphate pyrophosphatase